MNGHTGTKGLSQACAKKTMKVAPTTKAIRAALAVSAAMLALSGSGLALAGTCSLSAPATFSCNGVFTETVPGTIFVPVADLTLVLGDAAPTSVTPPTGDVGVLADWGGSTTVISFAEIATDGADGVQQYAESIATLTNHGSIHTYASSSDVNAVDISAFGDVTFDNDGDVFAYSYLVADVTAVSAFSFGGDVLVNNQPGGSIASSAYDGAATAVYAYAYGTVSVINDGEILAQSVTGSATGIDAVALTGLALVSNSGAIAAAGDGAVQGISAYSIYYDALVTNEGTVQATSYADAATGVVAVGSYASVVNSGDILVQGASDATGIYALGLYSATIENSGTIGVIADAGNAVGASAVSVIGDASVENSGSVSVTETSNLYSATGINAQAYYNATVLNSGSVEASGQDATAISASSYAGLALVENSGDITAQGAYSATGILASGAYGASVENSGNVSVFASGDIVGYGANLDATGVGVTSYFGDASVLNSGVVQVDVGGYGYNASTATGISVAAYAGNASVTNTGTVAVDSGAYAFYGSEALGISASSALYDATVVNEGSVSVNAGYGSAEGITAGSIYGNALVDNSGSVDVYGATSATGIYASTEYAGASIVNSGYVSVGSYGVATGVYAYSKYGASVDVNNAGSIEVSGDNANGAVATANYGDATVVNSGSIAVEGGYATGIAASARYAGSVQVENSGSLRVLSEYQSIGITADTKYGNSGTIDILNSGSIEVGSFTGVAAGIVSTGYAGTSIGNSGDITVSGFYYAAGIIASDVSGDIDIDNSGTLSVAAGPGSYYGAEAIGLNLSNYSGAISVANSGVIDVQASGYSILGSSAIGISAYNVFGDVEVANSGSISASAESDLYGYFYGTVATAVDVTNVYGNVTIGNEAGGEITASAIASHYYADATAISVLTLYGGTAIDNAGIISAAARTGEQGAFTTASATGITAVNYAGGDIVIDNSGSIEASATLADYSYYSSAIATGINAAGNYGGVSITNSGDLLVEASTGGGYGYDNSAYAYGIVAYGYDGELSIVNSGSIQANATTDGSYASISSATGISALVSVGGYAGIYIANSGTISASANDFATGIEAFSYGTGDYGVISIVNSGEISAEAIGQYDALAVGISASGYSIDIANSGDIAAYASGAYGHALGIYANALVDVYVENSGTITAGSDGASGANPAPGLASVVGDAVGVQLVSQDGEASLVNNGTITSTSSDIAVGVSLLSDIATSLINNGTITASGGAAGSIAVLTGAGADTIENSGTINGSLLTGAGDDSFFNDGIWNPVGSSDFGTGADLLSNTGTINIQGDVSVAVDIFSNDQILDFQDGAPNDTLTIIGDFAGDGDILVDVSTLLGASDMLYIEGNVLASSNSLIDVDFVGLPTTQLTEIPIVFVSGNSVAANFALGDVGFAQDDFLNLNFSLVADIDATNATDDVFSLAVNVAGLSDSGTLAAAVSPGVLSLMNTQVGTWRQRMGVIDGFRQGAVSLWARIFQDKGSINPGHEAFNFGQGGNYGFEQKNTGVEAGIDFAISDEFSLGLLVAKSKAEQRLDSPGVGSSEIEGDTYGIYGTWISPAGFYVDASYRWLDFEANLLTATGAMRAGGDADSFNIEAGYGWRLSNGLMIEPQLQYTRTRVDNIEPFNGISSVFESEGGDSSRGRVGVMVRKSFGSPDGTLWTPYASINAVREFDGKGAFSVNDDFFGENSLKGTSALAEVGFTARTGNLSVYGGLNWQDGGAYNSFVGGQLGVRYSFGGATAAVERAPMAAAPARTCADLDDDGDGVNNCDDKCPGSSAGQAIGPDGCPVPLTIDLRGVNFDFDQATLRADSVAVLDEAIAILGKYPDLKVAVVGHTDSIGSEDYNQGLSERRAGAVYDYLASHGVSAGRLVGPTGYGESRPIAPNTNDDGSDNPEGRARNRRTELNVDN